MNCISDPLSGGRVLVAYSNASTFTTTTLDYLDSFRIFGSAEYHYLHVTHDSEPAIDLGAYDAVLVSYCARLCFPGYVSAKFLAKLDQYDGVRAIAIQDEYDFVERERSGLDRVRPHIVFTCIPLDQVELVYPAARYPGTRFVRVLTGYVPIRYRPPEPRTIAARTGGLGYRGRSIGSRYGRLGRMKQDIGEVFLAECARRSFPADIAVNEQSRIYGENWFRWLGNCRCVLGSESGSNIFDMDGSIADACREAEATMREIPSSVRARIEELDATFSMGQVSPRIFESALVGTPMALYRGRYSEVVQPITHYIPIDHDHSNLDEVFSALSDLSLLQAMADRTHRDLIASNQYTYQAFVNTVEQAIADAVGKPVLGDHTDAPLESPLEALQHPPLLERPTNAPRHYDSFQLRMLRHRTEAGEPAAQILLRAARKSHWLYAIEKRLRGSATANRLLLRWRGLANEIQQICRSRRVDNTVLYELEHGPLGDAWRRLPSTIRRGCVPIVSFALASSHVRTGLAATSRWLRQRQFPNTGTATAMSGVRKHDSQFLAVAESKASADLLRLATPLNGREPPPAMPRQRIPPTPQVEKDHKNAAFWDELCGSQLARSIGVTDNGPESLGRYDDWYLAFYPYLGSWVPWDEMRDADVLEVGLGYGTVSQRLAERGTRFCGLDIAEGPVQMVNHRLHQSGLKGQVKRGSILEPPFAESAFDYIVAIGSLHHTGNLQLAIENCRLLLRPGGTLCFMVYYAYSYRIAQKNTEAMLEYARMEDAGKYGVMDEVGGGIRAAYDVNTGGTGAPHTDFVSRASLRWLCRHFSQFRSGLENIDQEPPFENIARVELLGTEWPHKVGLDLYAQATR